MHIDETYWGVLGHDARLSPCWMCSLEKLKGAAGEYWYKYYDGWRSGCERLCLAGRSNLRFPPAPALCQVSLATTGSDTVASSLPVISPKSQNTMRRCCSGQRWARKTRSEHQQHSTKMELRRFTKFKVPDNFDNLNISGTRHSTRPSR